MTLAEIYFDYDKAISQANQLDKIASRLESAADKDLEEVLDSVHKAWKSDNAGAYINKGEKVQTDMNKTVRNLRGIANTIRTIAKRVRDAELEAWRIAHERK